MLVDHVDLLRIDAGRRLDAEKQAELGQFMTLAPTARLMASMFAARGNGYGYWTPELRWVR